MVRAGGTARLLPTVEARVADPAGRTEAHHAAARQAHEPWRSAQVQIGPGLPAILSRVVDEQIVRGMPELLIKAVGSGLIERLRASSDDHSPVGEKHGCRTRQMR